MTDKDYRQIAENIKKYRLEYSGAAEPPFRKIGNRESETGNRHTDIVTFASLLA